MSARVYVSTDIETDGPLVGVNSMLSLGSAAFDEDGRLLACFSANLDTEEDGVQDVACMTEFWVDHPEEWAAARADARPIHVVMNEYAAWLDTLGGELVFVAYPANFDFSFVNHYLLRFVGRNPFGYCALDMKSFAAGLLGWPFDETSESTMPRTWFTIPNERPHHALSDALAQGHRFMAMLRDSKGRAAEGPRPRGEAPKPDAFLIEYENGGWQIARSFCGSLCEGETLVSLFRQPTDAALAAAREEGRISGLAALRERMLVEGDVLAWGSAGEGFSEYEEGVSWALDLLDKALKEAAS